MGLTTDPTDAPKIDYKSALISGALTRYKLTVFKTPINDVLVGLMDNRLLFARCASEWRYFRNSKKIRG